ncbi:MAG: hypothetical protein WKF92_11855 [Pyrinomonadaceae bacterium]
MRNFNNPLDNIHIASPCAASWDEMYGSDRKRFCGECKLNVYNLSDMTRREAENLLLNSEGRLCVKFFRRADGTVLTKNCPVGWQAVKARVSKTAAAVFSLLAGFFGGLFTVGAANSLILLMPLGDVPAHSTETSRPQLIEAVAGEVGNLSEVEGRVDLDYYKKVQNQQGWTVGRKEPISATK